MNSNGFSEKELALFEVPFSDRIALLRAMGCSTLDRAVPPSLQEVRADHAAIIRENQRRRDAVARRRYKNRKIEIVPEVVVEKPQPPVKVDISPIRPATWKPARPPKENPPQKRKRLAREIEYLTAQMRSERGQ